MIKKSHTLVLLQTTAHSANNKLQLQKNKAVIGLRNGDESKKHNANYTNLLLPELYQPTE